MTHSRIVWAAALLELSGCVTVYQPLVGLQRPTVVDPQEENFRGQSILIRCIPGKDLDAKQAQSLCQKFQKLFSNQGAEVEAMVPAEFNRTDESAGRKPDLTIDLRSRLVNRQQSTLLAFASIWTLTLIPTVTEVSFAQDVVIRDQEGFQLHAQTMEESFITYMGVGVWAVTGVLDWLVRSDDEQLGGDAAKHDFSRDLFRQLSQMTFHARMRAHVMRGFAEAPASQPLPPAALPDQPLTP